HAPRPLPYLHSFPTRRSSDLRHPAVSPDGKLIACFFVDEKGKTRIGILPFDGGELKTLDVPDSVSRYDSGGGVKWTPDGQALTYIDQPDASNIVSQPINGGPAKPLTSFKSDRIFNFAWSRDGKQIVYSRG